MWSEVVRHCRKLILVRVSIREWYFHLTVDETGNWTTIQRIEHIERCNSIDIRQAPNSTVNDAVLLKLS